MAEFTLNDFEYKFRLDRLRAVVCKHCGKKVAFTLSKKAPISDVHIHASHTCVAHELETPPVENVGMFFNHLQPKAANSVDNQMKSRPARLVFTMGKLGQRIKRLIRTA